MSFLSDAIQTFMNNETQSRHEPPPQTPPPWIPEWDDQQERWIFVNQQTGERTYQFPQQTYGDGGALLMQEGEQMRDGWHRDRDRAENDVYNAGQDVENFPEDAARWAGRTEQDVADIPQDVDRWEDRQEDRVEQKWDDGVQDVEDAPEDAARWTGEKVQEVEDIPGDIARPFENAWDGVRRFDDNMDSAYDQGQYEARRDD